MPIEPHESHFPAGYRIRENIYGIPLSQEGAYRWRIDRRRLGLEKEYTLLDAFHTSNIQVAYVRRSYALHIHGFIPPDSVTFAYFATTGRAASNTHAIQSNHLFAIGDEQPIDFVSQGPTDLFILTIHKDYFLKQYQTQLCTSYTPPSHANLFVCDEGTLSKAREQLHSYFKGIMSYRHPNETLLASYEAGLLQLILEVLKTKQDLKPAPQSHIQAHQALRYMHQNYTTAINMGSMCQELQTPERTMYESFKKLYGITPKNFLLYLRLGHVHEILTLGLENSRSIQDIAYSCGFVHMGRFSKSYKDFYGQTPSQSRLESLQGCPHDTL